MLPICVDPLGNLLIELGPNQLENLFNVKMALNNFTQQE